MLLIRDDLHLGYLAGVSGIIGSQPKAHEVNFTWSPPYTIAGVPVLGYQLNITIASGTDQRVINTSQVYVNDAELTVSKPESDKSPCIYVNISILATNTVGNGAVVSYFFHFSSSKHH